MSTTFEAQLVWMHERELDLGKSYLLEHTTRLVRMQVDAVLGRVNLSTLESVPAETLGLNDVGRVRITCHRPLYFDPYAVNRVTGSFIIVDSLTNATVGAGMIVGSDSAAGDQAAARLAARTQVSARERRERLGQAGVVVWVEGGEGALELAYGLERRLYDLGHAAHVLAPPPSEPPAAVSLACRALAEAGLIAVCVSHDATARAAVREAVGVAGFLDVRLGPEPVAGAVHDGRVVAEDLERGLERIVRLVGELGGFERS